VTNDIAAVFRKEYGRCVATLIRLLDDIGAAEEAVQEAFTVALAKWPVEGQPPNPGAWIVTTARNRAIDRLRRESIRDERQTQAHDLYGPATAEPAALEAGPVTDDRLRLSPQPPVASGPHSSPARWPRDAGDRPRLPRP